MTRAIRRAPWQRPKPLLTLRGSTIDPALRATVAMAIRCESWRYLTADGRYRDGAAA